jgi:hypothetical protein
VKVYIFHYLEKKRYVVKFQNPKIKYNKISRIKGRKIFVDGSNLTTFTAEVEEGHIQISKRTVKWLIDPLLSGDSVNSDRCYATAQ